MKAMINDDITLRYTACHNYFLVILQTLVDLVLEVILGRVLDGAGVEEPDAGLVLVLGDGVALGRQLARHVLAVAAVVGYRAALSLAACLTHGNSLSKMKYRHVLPIASCCTAE